MLCGIFLPFAFYFSVLVNVLIIPIYKDAESMLKIAENEFDCQNEGNFLIEYAYPSIQTLTSLASVRQH